MKATRKQKKELKRLKRQAQRQLNQVMAVKRENADIPLAIRLSAHTPFEQDIRELYANLQEASMQYTQAENLNHAIQASAQEIINKFKRENPQYPYDIDHDEIHLFFSEKDCEMLEMALESEYQMQEHYLELQKLREGALLAIAFQFAAVQNKYPDDIGMQSLAENLKTACIQMVKELI